MHAFNNACASLAAALEPDYDEMMAAMTFIITLAVLKAGGYSSSAGPCHHFQIRRQDIFRSTKARMANASRSLRSEPGDTVFPVWQCVRT